MRKLREFDLDAPSLDWSSRHEFRLQTRFLTANVERSFKSFNSPSNIWKVLVEVVPEVTEARILNLLGVLVCQVKGDSASYLTSNAGAKELLALEWLQVGVQAAFEKYDWPLNDFSEAVASVVRENYRNIWVWKKAVFNPSRSTSVEVVVEHTETEARIVAVFREKHSDQCAATTLCSTPPTEFEFVPCLGKLSWIDDNVVKLTSRSGEECWTAVRRNI